MIIHFYERVPVEEQDKAKKYSDLFTERHLFTVENGNVTLPRQGDTIWTTGEVRNCSFPHNHHIKWIVRDSSFSVLMSPKNSPLPLNATMHGEVTIEMVD